MGKAHQAAAKRRAILLDTEPCPECRGTGRLRTETAHARSKKGGAMSYLNSLQPGQLSMSERGRLGGRPRALTLADLDGGPRMKEVAAPADTAVQG